MIICRAFAGFTPYVSGDLLGGSQKKCPASARLFLHSNKHPALVLIFLMIRQPCLKSIREARRAIF